MEGREGALQLHLRMGKDPQPSTEPLEVRKGKGTESALQPLAGTGPVNSLILAHYTHFRFLSSGTVKQQICVLFSHRVLGNVFVQ